MNSGKNSDFLFQGAALFDSMTVEENVALPLVESKNGLFEGQYKENCN